MQIRYGAMNFPVVPILDEIDRIARLGFDYLELAMDPPRAHFSQIREQKAAILGALKSRSLGLVCHLPTFVNYADLTESLRNASLMEIISSIEVAAELEAEKVVLHPGMAIGLGVYVKETVERLAIENIGRILQTANRVGMRVCIENMPPHCGLFFEPEEFVTFFEQFPNMEMTFDIGHANIKGSRGQRISRFLKKLGDRMSHIHVSDNRGECDDHFPLGKGNLDLAKALSQLQQINYQGTVTLEVFNGKKNAIVESRERFHRLITR